MNQEAILDEVRDLPSTETVARAVTWHMFRTREEARERLHGICLEDGQSLIGGHSQDSVAPYWWVGVQVDNLEQWGHTDAVNLHGHHVDHVIATAKDSSS